MLRVRVPLATPFFLFHYSWNGASFLYPMEKTISFTVNGMTRTVTTDPDRPLLEVLREELELTGTKYGCGEGKCRACTVLLGGKSVASCITSVARAEKQTV